MGIIPLWANPLPHVRYDRYYGGTGPQGDKRRDNNMIDRSETARALAKAIAYKQCGKDEEARRWAKALIRLLELAEILKDE